MNLWALGKESLDFYREGHIKVYFATWVSGIFIRWFVAEPDLHGACGSRQCAPFGVDSKRFSISIQIEAINDNGGPCYLILK